MEIKKLEVNEVEDFRSLVEIFYDVFENDAEIPYNEHLLKVLSNPDFIAFVVKVEGKVIGGLSIRVLHQYYSIKPLAYIYDVGIAKAYQGKGYGKALMEEVCRYCKENGFEEAYVEAEADDTDAVNFYRKTNYSSEMNAIHFNYSFD